MSEQARLLRALKDSGIKRIAVVDDAFDVPDVGQDEWGEVRQHLSTPALQAAVDGYEELRQLLPMAVAAIEETEYESDALRRFLKGLFDRFAETRNAAFDPGGVFSSKRNDSLNSVEAIFQLLQPADPPVEVIRIGSMEDDDFAERIANIDLIFADLYLDAGVTITTAEDDPMLDEARRKSRHMIEEIGKIQGKEPAIILMSSKDVASRAIRFREDLGPRYIAARFQFVEKSQLVRENDGTVRVEEPASDALLDILQCYKFGEALSIVIGLWESSARAAVGQTLEAISKLEIRDFAYLIRFRLEKEGQDLIEYMEWLLGEYLVDAAGRLFYSSVHGEPKARTVSETSKSVSGAFEGQSEAVAHIYHKVRVEDPRQGRAPSIRMGDLFLSLDAQRVSAVITPDCDLVERPKRRAKRLTVVNGAIKAFDRKNPSAAEFILVDNAPKNIEWFKKDIDTHPFSWTQDAAQVVPLGTLRPLYAQQLQRAVLHDFGRVGLATWPGLYLTVEPELWYLSSAGDSKRLPLPNALSRCSVMPARPGAAPEERHMVFFTRAFMRKVRDTLASLDPAIVIAAGSPHLEELRDPIKGDSLVEPTCLQIQLESRLPHNILVTSGSAPGNDGWCWLGVRVSELR